MRVTVRWSTPTQRGRMPGRFLSVYDARKAAKAFMVEYPNVVLCAIYHETTGHVCDVKRVEPDSDPSTKG